MATLTLTKTYDDAVILYAVDFDSWLTELETMLNSTGLNDDNIQANVITQIADNSVSTAKFASDSVTTVKIEDSAVTAAKIPADNITTAKIAAATITSDEIAASAVTTAKILNSNVTTAKIADGAVTKAKLATLLKETATTSTGSFTLSTAGTNTITAVTNATVTITLTGGRPVFIGLQPISTSATDPSKLGFYDPSASYAAYYPSSSNYTTDLSIWFYRGSSIIAYTILAASVTTYNTYDPDAGYDPIATDIYIPSTYITLGLTPINASLPAGSTTFSVKVSNAITGTSLDVRNYKLVAYEL